MLERSFCTLRIGLKSLVLHKLRSGLTILGVVFGVGSVIVMLAVGEGARMEAIRQIQDLGATNIIVRSVKPAEAVIEEQLGVASYGLTKEDLERIQRAIPTVVWATPVREDRSQLQYHERTLTGRVVGVEPAYQQLNGLRLRQGRFISTLDNERRAAVAVLAAQTADTLFRFEDPVRRSVRIGEDQYYEVVGVTEPRGPSPGVGSNLPAQDYSFDIYIPYQTDKARFGEVISYTHTGAEQREKPQISQITVGVADMKHVKKTAELVEQLIAQFHTQPDTTITVPLDLLEKAEQTQRMFTLVLGAIASISLVVGGIGIMNIMLATVTERTQEIGIRRAVGANRRDIIRQFLLETVVLSSTGGVLGICLGIGLSHSVSRLFAMSTSVRPWSVLLAFTISVAVGLIFGTYPARRAAFLDPVEALRHE